MPKWAAWTLYGFGVLLVVAGLTEAWLYVKNHRD